MTRGKAQYSLEFLITYGWALLIIGIIISAIYAFGWIDASNFLPSKCTFYGQAGCRDFYLSETQFNLSLVNNFGANLIFKDLTLREGSNIICTEPNINALWNRGSFVIIGCTTSLTKNSRFEGTAIISFYSNSTCPNGINPLCVHNTTGIIIGKVQ